MGAETARVDPRQLTPGSRVRHRSGSVHVLDRRKEDDTGWWLSDSGGLADFVWDRDDSDWTVIRRKPEA